MNLGGFITSINFIVLVATSCWAGSIIETQVGPFNVAGSFITESALISKYGNGYVMPTGVKSTESRQLHVYYVSSERLWVAITVSNILSKDFDKVIEEVFVTKTWMNRKKIGPGKSFGPLVTSKGIKLGDSFDKVVKTYGDPSVVIDIEKHKAFSAIGEKRMFRKGRILRYLTDRPDQLTFMEFYFAQNRLHSLLISRSE